MKASEAWLREWVDPEIGTDELVARLTMAGLEVDAVEPAAAPFSGVVVAEITVVDAHPDAEKLRVCTVDDGSDSYQVVCGAANAAVGLRVPFARIAAQLPGGLLIERAELRGVESSGMLCGAAELGLEDAVDGLMVLPQEAPLGEDFRRYLQLDDAVIELDLTPNRGDCLSIQGVAREIGVLTSTDVSAPAIEAVAASCKDALSVDLAAADYCPRYAGRVIRGVDLQAQTPLWMREKLRRADIRCIDPVVDTTNYVMIELGQPLHAFDLAKLSGDIIVRRAQAGESLTLLDDSQQTLDSDMLVIADQQQALALAGIMGGNDSAVSAETVDIFLESAFFVPHQHAGIARKLGLHTDASHRFERGVDSQLQVRAIERATQLLLAIVGGEAGPVTLAETVDQSAEEEGRTVVLRQSQIQRVLGFAIPAERVVEMLQRLDLSPQPIEGGWQVSVPSHRFDIAIEADLLEELARIYGYDQLPVEPPTLAMQFTEKPESQLPLLRLKQQLLATGYREAITYSFIDAELQRHFDADAEPVTLLNPIASDMATMRSSLLPGLVEAVKYNLNRQQTRLKLFESGLSFQSVDGQLQQRARLAGALVGPRRVESWLSKREATGKQPDVFDFYDIKADVQSLLALAGSRDDDRFVADFAEKPLASLHPGQSARIYRGERSVGVVGLLHPQLQKTLALDSEVWLFELELDLISDKKVPEFKELSKFPEVRRDLAVIVDSAIAAADVVACVRAAAGSDLLSLHVFDQYSGAGIDDGKQSIGLGLTWQHRERTLNESEVNALIDGVVASLQQRFNASLR